MLFYTYAHVRPDTGHIFYVGKGRNRRAYCSSKRSLHWCNIVKKNSGKFTVRILNWFADEQTAYISEMWQIATLQPLGFLVNKTPGGESPPIIRMFGDKNPMTRPAVAEKAKKSAERIRKDPVYRARISKARKGKALGDANAMRKPENIGIFSGAKNAMAKYEHREKHYSNNKTRGKLNGMYGRCGAQNPAFGKPSAMRGRKNLGLAWAAQNKTWQPYWGA